MTEQITDQQVWNSLDGILVINLTKDTERMQVWQRDMGAYLPADRIHWVQAVAGWELPGYRELPWFTGRTGERAKFWGGVAGCTLSHRKAIETARDAGWKHVLILEDDTQMADNAELTRLAQAFARLRDEYLLYLGCHEPGPYGECVDSRIGLWKIEGALATHAYILTSGMYDRLLDELPTVENVWDWISRNKAVDVFYRNKLSRMSGVGVYALLPNLVCQNALPSRIVRDAASTDPDKMYRIPYPLYSLRGAVHTILKPLRQLKLYFNSLRTYRRARRKGFPGYNKHR